MTQIVLKVPLSLNQPTNHHTPCIFIVSFIDV